MPYAMTHLIIADRFAEKRNIPERELFLLANVAPDAVHARRDYRGEIKAGSHYLQPEETWGEVYEEVPMNIWYARLKSIYTEKQKIVRNEKDDSFLKGYFLHILADIFNGQLLYGPNLIKYGTDDVTGFRRVYRSECLEQDFYLYQTCPKNREIMESIFCALDDPDLGDIIHHFGFDENFSLHNLKDKMVVQVQDFRSAPRASLDDLEMITEESTKRIIEHMFTECDRMLYDFPDPERTFRMD